MADLIIYRESLAGHEITMLGTGYMRKNADYWEFDTSSGLTLGIRHMSADKFRVYLVKGEYGHYNPQPYIGEFLKIRPSGDAGEPDSTPSSSWGIVVESVAADVAGHALRLCAWGHSALDRRQRRAENRGKEVRNSGGA